MGLAHRVIPTFLVNGESLVKGRGFAADRVVGHARQAILVQASRGVDEVMILDVAATREGRGPDLALVERISAGLFAPLAVGGGVRTVEDVRALLRAGADKVVIGAAFMERAHFVREAANVVGSQALVISLDVRGRYPTTRCGTYPWVISPTEYAEGAQRDGAGEILLQSVDRDGTMQGYDLDLIRSVSAAVSVPVIASGGAGTYEHMREAIEAGASAVAAGAMFAFTDQTPKGAAQYLAANGIEARV